MTTLLRLRPVVHASPVPEGVHVRGGRSSFTAGGGDAVWRLWQALAVRLADGVTEAELLTFSAQPGVRQAVTTVLRQLRAHDMIAESVPDPVAPHQIARWLESVAADPAAAWAKLAVAEVTLSGAGPVAASARRSLHTSGIAVRQDAAASPGALLVCGEHAVAAAADGETAVVTPPGPAAARDLVALTTRLKISLPSPDSGPVLAALAGGAAAHRLICAVAGLADPAHDRYSRMPTVPLGVPAALVARLDPLRAGYHPWPGSQALAGPADLAQTLSRLDMLTDPELGLIAPASSDDLPQLPTGLAEHRVGAQRVVGIGVDATMARLSGTLGAAEKLTGSVVGVDALHADGVMLRRLAAAREDLPGRPLAAAAWAASAPARTWWKALTLRFGLPATLELTQLAEGVHHAAVRADGLLLSWAVEADPADAAAFAALTAAGLAQWRAARPGLAEPAVPHPPCGAMMWSTLDPDDGRPWRSRSWTWPAGLRVAEPSFQERLRRLTLTGAVRPLSNAGKALRDIGFTVLGAPQ